MRGRQRIVRPTDRQPHAFGAVGREMQLLLRGKEVGLFLYGHGERAVGFTIRDSPQATRKMSASLKRKFLLDALLKLREMHGNEFKKDPRIFHTCIETKEGEKQLNSWGIFSKITTLDEAIRLLQSRNARRIIREKFAIRDRKKFRENIGWLLELDEKNKLGFSIAGYPPPPEFYDLSAKHMYSPTVSKMGKGKILRVLEQYFKKFPYLEVMEINPQDRLYGRRTKAPIRIEDLDTLNAYEARVFLRVGSGVSKNYKGLMAKGRKLIIDRVEVYIPA